MSLTKNIFVTGPPGSGKSSLLMQVVRILEQKKIRVKGILCPEIRQQGRRWGFRFIVYPDNIGGILASVEIKEPPYVSKYGVDLISFERIGVKALESILLDDSVDVVLIDEIGKMELLSSYFRRVVSEALNSRKIILGVLGRIRDPLVFQIRRRPDTKIFVVDRSLNFSERERIISSIIHLIDAYLKQPRFS